MFPKIDSVGTLDTKIDWSATVVTLILGNMEPCNLPNSENTQSGVPMAMHRTNSGGRLGMATLKNRRPCS